MVSTCSSIGLGEILFVETRVKALPSSVMAKSIRERLPVELRNRFPGVGLENMVGSIALQPTKILMKPFDIVGIDSLGDQIRLSLHVGMPAGTSTKAQLKFDKMDEIAKVVREFAAKRGWVMATYYPDPNFKPIHFRVYFYLLPDKTAQVEGDNLPSYLYHLTDVENVDVIRRDGLKPRSKATSSRSYPGRVYVFADKRLMNDMLELSLEIHRDIANGESVHQTPLTKTPHVAIVKINPSKLRKGTKFYIDPEFDGEPGALYTYTHIPPEAVVDVDQVS